MKGTSLLGVVLCLLNASVATSAATGAKHQLYKVPSRNCSPIHGHDKQVIGELCSVTTGTHLHLDTVMKKTNRQSCKITGVRFCNVPFVISLPFEPVKIPLEEVQKYMCAFDDKVGKLLGTVESKCVKEGKEISFTDKSQITFECNGIPEDTSPHSIVTKKDWPVKPYRQVDIIRTKSNLIHFEDYVLVFDGTSGDFYVFNLDSTGCGRRAATRVMVDYFRRILFKRFRPGQQSFQVHYRVQSAHTECINFPESCDVENFSPILTFASVPKDQHLLPSQIDLPHEYFLQCMPAMRNNTDCSFGKTTNRVKKAHLRSWSELKPQVVWRGSDYPTVSYMDATPVQDPPVLTSRNTGTCQSIIHNLVGKMEELSPRWRCVTMSIQADVEAAASDRSQKPWIDCKFHGVAESETYDLCNNVSLLSQTRMSVGEAAVYRYHLDLGGLSGTSWRSTIQKLAMPGLLFHHETPMKEWFYDDLEPWVHYVPVEFDLSDLKEKFDWAEANPEKAEEIAQAGTEFYNHLMSKEYVKSVYKDIIGRNLNRVVEAYRPEPNETPETIFKRYKAKFPNTSRVAICSRGVPRCNFQPEKRLNPDW